MRESPDDMWQPSKRLDRGNAAEQILEDLREQILGGHLARGAKLPTEKQLAQAYGVSGPTVREAIRGLTTARLIEVRHGSGAYVTAHADQLIDVSLRSLIQMERIGISQVLAVLGELIGFSAELAATRASRGDLEELQRILDDISNATKAEQISGGFLLFVDALASASGNPLLTGLCRFLVGVQIGLAAELSGNAFEAWKKTSSRLAKDRQALVDAIGARDPALARSAARTYNDRAVKMINALPNAATTIASDTGLSTFVASMLTGSKR